MTIGDADSCMWPYQVSFRVLFTRQVKDRLECAGFDGQPEVMLIGFPAAGAQDKGVCIEAAEDCPYIPSDLASLSGGGGQPHGWPRVRALERTLTAHRASGGRSFFASRAARVGGYDVHPVVSVGTAALERVPRLGAPVPSGGVAVPGIIHAIIIELLEFAWYELHLPDAGLIGTGRLGTSQGGSGAAEVFPRAINQVLRTVLTYAGHVSNPQADDDLRDFTSLMYEGRPTTGCLIIAPHDHPAIRMGLSWTNKIPLGDYRHVRKLLEATGKEGALLIDDRFAYGLARIMPEHDLDAEPVFGITVSGPAQWRLTHAGTALLDVEAGMPKLPRTAPDYCERLRDTAARVLPGADLDVLEELVKEAGTEQHGAMLIISSKAAEEADRLTPQATCTRRDAIAPELLAQLTNMDGGILVDPQGRCHAHGIILDGTASHNGDPARGSRYNNAVRYLAGSPPPAVVVCYSSDGDVTIMPKLRPRIWRQEVGNAVAEYVAACEEDPPDLDKIDVTLEAVTERGFYLNHEQCEKLNRAREIHIAKLLASGESATGIPFFAPDPMMSDDYWLPMPPHANLQPSAWPAAPGPASDRTSPPKWSKARKSWAGAMSSSPSTKPKPPDRMPSAGRRTVPAYENSRYKPGAIAHETRILLSRCS